ncbi:hypothetical protein [Quadrisphaera sp. INWT6]|uniref:hypothetical protein n=1 Tax=Quadrisphaera sp. INWT6 TaxID=2596917 RepID=UPI0018923A4B|nr:hypothetical protein [Quadrisphaera sp. INWT6]MBF5082671.1 hypothetical protein [Quadrisphaera sp. INWT6]
MRRTATAAATAACALALAGCSAVRDLDDHLGGHSCTDVGVFEVMSVDLTRVLPFEGGDYDVVLALPDVGLTTTTTLTTNSDGPLEVHGDVDLDDEPVAVAVEARGPDGAVVYRGSGTHTPVLVQPNGPRCDPDNHWLTLQATDGGELVPLDPYGRVTDDRGRLAISLYTECGVQWLDDPTGTFGPWVREAGALDDGAGGPPPGWGAPYQRGWAAFTGDRVVFEDELGHREVFRPSTGADRYEPYPM